MNVAIKTVYFFKKYKNNSSGEFVKVTSFKNDGSVELSNGEYLSNSEFHEKYSINDHIPYYWNM